MAACSLSTTPLPGLSAVPMRRAANWPPSLSLGGIPLIQDNELARLCACIIAGWTTVPPMDDAVPLGD